MKKLIFTVFLSLLILSLSAQQKGKVRIGADIGLGLTTNGGGFTGGLDLRYNILDNLNAGLKFGSGMLLKNLSNSYVTTGVFAGLLFTGDYYFSRGTNSFAPFIGGGIGSFSNLNVYVDENSQNNVVWTEIPIEKSIGGIIRAGFELGKIRLSAEYYLIPSTKLYDITLAPTGQNSSNSFLNISAGLYIGGGKWRKGTL